MEGNTVHSAFATGSQLSKLVDIVMDLQLSYCVNG